jgi:hypothetical protein
MPKPEDLRAEAEDGYDEGANTQNLGGTGINLARRVCILIDRRYILRSVFGSTGVTEGRSAGPTQVICNRLNLGFRERFF